MLSIRFTPLPIVLHNPCAGDVLQCQELTANTYFNTPAKFTPIQIANYQEYT